MLVIKSFSDATGVDPSGTTDDAQVNQIELKYTVRMLDHQTLSHDHTFNLTSYVFYGGIAAPLVPVGDTTLTVNAPESDATDLVWNAYIENPPASITKG